MLKPLFGKILGMEAIPGSLAEKILRKWLT